MSAKRKAKKYKGVNMWVGSRVENLHMETRDSLKRADVRRLAVVVHT